MQNVMTDTWTVFGRDQGQSVERAYRFDYGDIIRRTTDRADGRVTYDTTRCPDDVEWNGSEGVAPWTEPLDWQPCAVLPDGA